MKNFRKRLAAKHPVAIHLIVILFLMVLFGIALGRILLRLGMTNFVTRDALVIAASYGFFFILVKLWLRYIAADSINIEESAVDQPQSEITGQEVKAKKSRWYWFDWVPVSGDYVGFLLLLGFVVALLGVLWVVIEGPVILTEVAFEVALSAGLARAVQKQDRDTWYEGLLRRTFLAFFIFWTAAFISLSMINETCPGKQRLSQVAKECWFK